MADKHLGKQTIDREVHGAALRSGLNELNAAIAAANDDGYTVEVKVIRINEGGPGAKDALPIIHARILALVLSWTSPLALSHIW